ncbi:MAG: type II toxin-antitoxin system HicB family antitoxin [Gammaproteobacteria bacterium]|nr:type II toxin-antitoxin system HicB family antitoxin [Gammaproteobacteria bacterium]
MKFTVVIERGDNSFGAYVPGIPGCVAAGASKAEALRLIKEAIQFHIEGLREDGETLLANQCEFAQVEVDYA